MTISRRKKERFVVLQVAVWKIISRCSHEGIIEIKCNGTYAVSNFRDRVDTSRLCDKINGLLKTP